MIPTREMCEQLWDEKRLPDDLRSHLAAVAALSVKIGKALKQKGFSLSIPLIEAAALLHDIEKGKPHHAAAGADTLAARGYTETASIVKAHMRLPEGTEPEITEHTIVFLADKMMIGSEAVRPEKRYNEKLSIYGGEPPVAQNIRKQLEMSLELERKITRILGVDSL